MPFMDIKVMIQFQDEDVGKNVYFLAIYEKNNLVMRMCYTRIYQHKGVKRWTPQ